MISIMHMLANMSILLDFSFRILSLEFGRSQYLPIFEIFQLCK